MALFGGFDAGSVFVRLGAILDPSGFDQFDRAVSNAQGVKELKASLGGNFDDSAFRTYDQALAEVRAKAATQAQFQAKLGADFNPQAFDRYWAASQRAHSSTVSLGRAVNTLWVNLKRAASQAIALGLAYVSWRQAKAAISVTEGLASATIRLSRTLGLNIKQASEWAAIVKSRNIDTNVLAQSFTALSKQQLAVSEGSKTATRTFKELGISQGEVKKLGFQDLVLRVADAFKQLGPHVNKAALLQRLFGRGAKELGVFISGGSKAIKEQLGLADRLGATFGGKSLNSVHDLIKAQREARLATMGLQIAFGTALAPTLTKGIMKFSEFVQQIHSGTGTGGKFVDLLKRMATSLYWVYHHLFTVAKSVREFTDQHPALLLVVENLAKVAAATKFLQILWKWSGFKSAFEGFQSIGKALKSMHGWLTADATKAGFLRAKTLALAAATKVMAAAQWILNAAMAANPYVLAALAVAALGAAFVIAYKKSETFRRVIGDVVTAVRKVLAEGVRLWLTPLDLFLLGLQKVMEAASHLPFVGDKFRKAADGIRAARNEMHRLVDAIDGHNKKQKDAGSVLDANTRAYRANADQLRKSKDAVDQFGTSVQTDRPRISKLGDEVGRLRAKLGALDKGSDAYKVTAGRLGAKQSALNDAIRSASPAAAKASHGFASVRQSAQNMAGVVVDARGKIVSTINTLAKAVGIKSLPLADFKSGNLPMGTFGGKAGGGWLGSPGQAGQDTIRTAAPLGSVILNRHQIPHAEMWSRAAGLGGLNRLMSSTHAGGGQMVPFVGGAGELVLGPQAAGALNGALGMSPFGGLSGLFSSVSRKHYMAAGGSLTGMIRAANQLDRAHFPYVWGGGHQGSPAPFGPMDCSGAVSYVLQHGGVPIPTMTSGLLASAGLPGPGAATVFANPTHTFMRLGARYFGTSGSNDNGGAGWFPDPGPSYRSRFTQRHFMAALMAIPRILVKGRSSAMRTDAQGSADIMRRFGNRYLSAAQSTVLGGGNPGDSGPAVRGRMSTFGPPLEAAGMTASGVSSARPGIAIFNRGTLRRMFRVVLGGHQAMLTQTDLGPAPWTGRKIDVTGAGSMAMGINPRSFPTDAIGAAYPRASGGMLSPPPPPHGRPPVEADAAGGGPRLVGFLRRVWNAMSGARPGVGPPHITLRHAKFPSRPFTYTFNRDVHWPTWVSESILRGKGPYSGWAQNAAVHEFAHTMQRENLSSPYEVEGGAQNYSDIVTPRTFGRLGYPYSAPGDSNYAGYVRWVRRFRGRDWTLGHRSPFGDRGQFRFARGGPVATGGHRQRSDLQQRSLDQMLKVWRVAKGYYPGASGFPKTLFIPNSIFAGMASNPGGGRAGREVIWPDWLLRATRQDPANSALKETMVHEWAHYFQRPSVTRGPTWQAEGGAQAFARAHAAQIMSAAGLPYRQGASRYDTYMGYVRRVRGQLGQKWIDRGQFVGKGGGGWLQAFAGGGTPTLGVHLSPPKKGHGGGGGTKLDLHRFTAPLHVRIARYDHLQALNDDDAKRYEQKDREFGFSEEVLIDETTGAVNVEAVKARVNELTQLIAIRQRIYNRLIKMQATAKKVINTYRNLLKALRNALKHAAKKERPGIKTQIKNYSEDLSKWIGQAHDLGFDVNSARLDVKEITLERDSVAGTTATPQDTGPGGETTDNPDLAAQLAQALTVADNLRRENVIANAALETLRGPGDIGSGASSAIFAAGGRSLAGAISGGGSGLQGAPGAAGAGGLNSSSGNIIIQTLHPADSKTLAAIAVAANRGNGLQGYKSTTRFVTGI